MKARRSIVGCRVVHVRQCACVQRVQRVQREQCTMNHSRAVQCRAVQCSAAPIEQQSVRAITAQSNATTTFAADLASGTTAWRAVIKTTARGAAARAATAGALS